MMWRENCSESMGYPKPWPNLYYRYEHLYLQIKWNIYLYFKYFVEHTYLIGDQSNNHTDGDGNFGNEVCFLHFSGISEMNWANMCNAIAFIRVIILFSSIRIWHTTYGASVPGHIVQVLLDAICFVLYIVHKSTQNSCGPSLHTIPKTFFSFLYRRYFANF